MMGLGKDNTKQMVTIKRGCVIDYQNVYKVCDYINVFALLMLLINIHVLKD